MRHLKLLGLALLAVFALGTAAASVASATEVGILFLGTETAPLGIKVAAQAVASSLTLLPNGTKVECTGLGASAGTIGTAPETHSTLGSLEVDYTGCKSAGVACTSLNTKGEKNTKELILLAKEDTDVHTVALSGTLAPGLLVGLLELEKKLDLTLSCGLVTVKVLGAIFLEVKGKNLGTEETKEVELIPTTLTCASTDTLCKEELAKWGTTVGGKVCPLAGTTKAAENEECADYLSAAVKATFDKKVTLDF